MSPHKTEPGADGAGWQAAGFWRRYAAWSLDWALLSLPLALLLSPLLARAWRQLQLLQQQLQAGVDARIFALDGELPSALALGLDLLRDPALAAVLREGSQRLTLMFLQVLLLGFLVSALYFVASEAGPWQATPGKRLLRLRVRAADGGVAGPRRALLRHLGGALSWALLNLGHAMVAFRRDRRALHDLIADTRVLSEGAMPGWARAWLWLQAAVGLGAFALLLGYLGWLLLQLAQA